MKANWLPYALFVVVNLDEKTINETLGATSGSYGLTYWLATEDYSDAPKKKSSNVHDCTKPPIPKDYRSPWIGGKIDDIIQWLQAKPDDTGFNPRFFAVLDNGSKDDSPTVVVCRIGNMDSQGDKVFAFRYERVRAVEHLTGAPQDVWDELTRYGHGDAEINYGDDA